MFAKRLSLTVSAVAVIAATSVAATQAGGAAPARTARLTPFLVGEKFTPLPCSGAPGQRTTLQMEGCAEQEILKTDRQIDVLAAQIFPILPSDGARRRFNAAQRAWLSYRNADCLSVSDLFEGGTAAPVVAAQCDVNRNKQHVKDLRAFHRDLTRTG